MTETNHRSLTLGLSLVIALAALPATAAASAPTDEGVCVTIHPGGPGVTIDPDCDHYQTTASGPLQTGACITLHPGGPGVTIDPDCNP